MKILHLSDVHFGVRDNDADQEQVTRSLVRCIHQEAIKCDFIFFTGDLANYGKKEEFERAEAWLTEISEHAEAPVILCPGNHDLDRKQVDITTVKSAVPSDELFNLNKVNLYKSHPQFQNFLEWHTNAKSTHAEVFLNNWDVNPSLDVVHTEVNGSKISLICVNSALLSHSDKDEGNLAFDVGALQSQLTKATDEGRLSFLLLHHPTSWLVPWCKEKIEKIIARPDGPVVYFHGHLHDQESVSRFDDKGRNTAVASAGATYQGTKYPQFFSVVSLDFDSPSMKSDVFFFNDDLGQWELNGSMGRQIPLKIPRSISVPKPDRAPVAVTKPKYENPFSFVVANDMDPAEIPRLFVESSNFLGVLSKNFDSFVEGQRGTGKTMLLRYFSAPVQSTLPELKDVNGDFNSLDHIGVYCRLSQFGFNRTDFKAVSNEERKLNLFEQRLVPFLFSNLFLSLSSFIDTSSKLDSDWIDVAKRLSKLLREPEIEKAKSWEDLSEAINIRCDDLMHEVDNHVMSLLPGSEITTFNTWLSISNTFVKFLVFFKTKLSIDVPFFLLLDDFDGLSSLQQRAIYTVAAERNHSVVCFKFGSMSYGSESKVTITGATYRRGDDYDYVPLNWVDGGLHNDSGSGSYKTTVLEVANRRLENAGWTRDRTFQSLLDTWKHGTRIREKNIKDICRQKYDSTKGEKPATFQAYLDKNRDIEFLRYLRHKKIELRYAGINTVVDVSSGIYRQFLELCSKIVGTALDSNWSPESGKKIGMSIQNMAIRSYSEDLLGGIGKTAGDASRREFTKHEITSQNLVNLAVGLCEYFNHRLYNTDLKDAAVIDFSVRGNINYDCYGSAVLRIAVRESILQQKERPYTDKSNPAKSLPTYTLNRRLTPKYNLHPKMRGRVELSIDDIEMAAKDPSMFLKSKKVKHKPLKGAVPTTSEPHLFDKEVKGENNE